MDYDALTGTRPFPWLLLPAPHAEILKIAKEILAEKDITLDIHGVSRITYIPNNVVEQRRGAMQTTSSISPIWMTSTLQNGTHLVSVAAIHVEPMGLYGGKQTTLDAIMEQV